jgi:hypothetical protein
MVVLRKILLRIALWLDRKEVNSSKDRRHIHIRALLFSLFFLVAKPDEREGS